MQNYDFIVGTISCNIIFNFILIIIMLGILLYNIFLIKKVFKNYKDKKQYIAIKQYYRIVVCLLSVFFVLYFSIAFVIDIKTRIALERDRVEQYIDTKEIEFGYSRLSDKHITMVVDKRDREIKYYYIPSLPGIDKNEVITGNMYIISYYKNSKVICDIKTLE